MKIVLDLNEHQAEALYQALDSIHQECLAAEDNELDPPVDSPMIVAETLDILIAAYRQAKVTGF